MHSRSSAGSSIAAVSQLMPMSSVPRYDIGVDVLDELPAADREAALARTRDEMSHRSLEPERWPLLPPTEALAPIRA